MHDNICYCKYVYTNVISPSLLYNATVSDGID